MRSCHCWKIVLRIYLQGVHYLLVLRSDLQGVHYVIQHSDIQGVHYLIKHFLFVFSYPHLYDGMMLRSVLARAVRKEDAEQGDNVGDQLGISLIEHCHTFQDIPSGSKVICEIYCLA